MELDLLKRPFAEECLEWRIQSSGQFNDRETGQPRSWAQIVPYLTNRAIQDRLDEICGPENWTNAFKAGPCGGVLCGIGIKIGDTWVWKWDGAENTDVESVKGGFSDSMKRAAVQWSIGRYLYHMPTKFAICSDTKPDNLEEWKKAKHKARPGEKDKVFWWKPPVLDPAFLPEPSAKTQLEKGATVQPRPERRSGTGRVNGSRSYAMR